MKLKQPNSVGEQKLKLALVTERRVTIHERIIRTFRSWNISKDQAFFLVGMPKDRVLKEFRPHIFFDDQAIRAIPASKLLPSRKVPSINTS